MGRPVHFSLFIFFFFFFLCYIFSNNSIMLVLFRIVLLFQCRMVFAPFTPGDCGLDNENADFTALSKGKINRMLTENDGYCCDFLTCMCAATEGNQLNVVQFLIDQGDDVDKESGGKRCYQPLKIAAKKGYLSMVELLIGNGADVNHLGSRRHRDWPIHHAATPEIIRTLVEHGANIEALDYDYITPLHRAIRSRQLENIKEFLKLGASLDKATKGPRSAVPKDRKALQEKFDARDFKTNYCRNPNEMDGDLMDGWRCDGAWCYTMENATHWESCGIPTCQDIDECQPNPCVHGTCTDGVNRYTCQCSPGHRGDNCDEVRPVRYVRVTP